MDDTNSGNGKYRCIGCGNLFLRNRVLAQQPHSCDKCQEKALRPAREPKPIKPPKARYSF